MQNFINDTIDTNTLPRFEEVQLTPLQSRYWKVIVYNLCFTFIIIGAALGAGIYFIEEMKPYWIIISSGWAVLFTFFLIIYRISFKNRGYAFRTHDAIYRSGAISIRTTIIPYNRVQHAALHEGWLARYLGLATIEIFTAGGANSDIKIPGIEKEKAENIKQLLMGKIITEVQDGEDEGGL